MESTLP